MLNANRAAKLKRFGSGSSVWDNSAACIIRAEQSVVASDSSQGIRNFFISASGSGLWGRGFKNAIKPASSGWLALGLGRPVVEPLQAIGRSRDRWRCRFEGAAGG